LELAPFAVDVKDTSPARRAVLRDGAAGALALFL